MNRAQLDCWNGWCDEHRYPDLVRAAVARALEGGADWRASRAAGQHGVRVEAAPREAHLGLRLAGFRHDAGEWVWWP